MNTPSTPDASAFLAAMPGPDAVRTMEAHLADLPQVALNTSHVVHGGMCARTIRIPADTILTGALTNTDNICILHGDITVTTDEGPVRLTGFHVLPAKKGAKRAGMTHADTYWTTVWPTKLTDIEAIEDEFTPESENLQTRRTSLLAQQDYQRWVIESGLSERFIADALAFTADLIETSDCFVKLRKGPSAIDGTGVFATSALKPGEYIAPGRRDGMRCVAGRFANHSPQPNARFVADGEDLNLVAIEDISVGVEVTVDYRRAVAVNTTFQEIAP